MYGCYEKIYSLNNLRNVTKYIANVYQLHLEKPSTRNLSLLRKKIDLDGSKDTTEAKSKFFDYFCII